MDKTELKVGDFVRDTSKKYVIGEVFYGAWKNIGIGVNHTQYGAYILWYDEDWFRVGFDNLNFNYIERTDRTFPTMPQS